ncbi:hypothetical protein Q5752_004923 [Cryptotrichosporon argae]
MPARRSALGPDGSPLDGREKETFGCPFPGCGQSYSRMEYLKRHQRKHQDVRPFQCRDCSKAFARSDVLLRHRRRCHPTPPPAERSSHSPIPLSHAHPSVPISSSRTSERDREASPPHRPRKQARQTSPRLHDHGHGKGNGHGALRLSDDIDEEIDADDDDRYGRFARNGMGNGGVFSYGSSYYTQPADTDSAAYTPHLLPILGQYHHLTDANHLEDASALLSMAYPTGVPANGSGNGDGGGSGSAVQAMPDWEGAQTIGSMIMAAADAGEVNDGLAGDVANAGTSVGAVDANIGVLASNFSLGAVEDPARPAAPGPVLSESMGGVDLSWLAQAGVPPKESDAVAWPMFGNPLRPPSPLGLSSIFSPTTLGLAGLAPLPPVSDVDESDPLTQANNSILGLLEQMAKYEVPQTKNNPNPERPLLRLEHSRMVTRAGMEADKNSRFYLPADRFAGCYQIPHWALPPLKTLSFMASKTFHTILTQFSFVHAPTFRLIDTAACLAFAICTVGGIRPGRGKAVTAACAGAIPEAAIIQWCADFEADAALLTDDVGRAKRAVDEWEGGQVVRQEKTNMLVKSFSMAKGVLMTEYNVALLQALILYHAPYFLSDDCAERSHANMFMGTIVMIARQIGFFTRELDHFNTTIELPRVPHTPADVDRCWKRWISLESRRRTAWLIYQFDTVSALESGTPCHISPCELAHLPLPASDTLWKAETADEWLAAARAYRPMALDEAMRRTFFLPAFGAFDGTHEKAQRQTAFYALLNQAPYGPFARTSMILTLLRGVIDLGQGKRAAGDWSDLTDLWINCEWLRPTKVFVDAFGNDLGQITRESLSGRFELALSTWRQGWDFDPLCSSALHSFNAATKVHASRGSSLWGSSGSASGSGSSTSPDNIEELLSASPDGASKDVLHYCEEALPFYWLAQMLLGIMKSAPAYGAVRHNAFADVNFGQMLANARAFTRMGEGMTGLGV